jgi:hypothetical protein
MEMEIAQSLIVLEAYALTHMINVCTFATPRTMLYEKSPCKVRIDIGTIILLYLEIKFM